MQALHTKVSQLQEVNSQLQQQVLSLQATLVSEREVFAHLRSSHERIAATNAQLEKEKRTLKHQLTHLKKEVETRRCEARQLQDALQASHSAVESQTAKAHRLEAEQKEVQWRNSQLRDDNQALQTALSIVQTDTHTPKPRKGPVRATPKRRRADLKAASRGAVSRKNSRIERGLDQSCSSALLKATSELKNLALEVRRTLHR